MSTARMAITTRSSISVKPEREARIAALPLGVAWKSIRISSPVGLSEDNQGEGRGEAGIGLAEGLIASVEETAVHPQRNERGPFSSGTSHARSKVRVFQDFVEMRGSGVVIP